MSGYGSELEMVLSGLRARVEGLAVEYADAATTAERKEEILGWFRGWYAMLTELEAEGRR